MDREVMRSICNQREKTAQDVRSFNAAPITWMPTHADFVACSSLRDFHQRSADDDLEFSHTYSV
jgi:hypothetical protein